MHVYYFSRTLANCLFTGSQKIDVRNWKKDDLHIFPYSSFVSLYPWTSSSSSNHQQLKLSCKLSSLSLSSKLKKMERTMENQETSREFERGKNKRGAHNWRSGKLWSWRGLKRGIQFAREREQWQEVTEKGKERMKRRKIASKKESSSRFEKQ